MKKSRFLWIRDLPDNCRSSEIRGAFERCGVVQNVRMYRNGGFRHAVVAFADTNSAVRALDTGVKVNEVILKPEYCDSLNFMDSTLKVRHESEHLKGPSLRMLTSEGFPERVLSTDMNGQTSRSLLVTKHVNGRTSSNKHSSTQVLRPVQSSTLSSFNSSAWRGLKLSHLPPLNKLSDEHLRQGLFTEFRRCGRILSVVLSGNLSGIAEFSRVAIVTFRRPEEAESAYRALHSGEKLLFSTSVVAERHPGFTGPEKSPDTLSTLNVSSDASGPNVTTMSAISSLQNVYPTSVSNPKLQQDQLTLQTSAKCPTRTLYVGGLTAGPTGPVTSDHLTTAFRKFGDILDVQLQYNSNSALIQFAEMRGPLRAMNAHTRDPLRLGGRPLFLAYVPSSPSTGLWFSDLPPSLATLSDDDLFRRLSNFAAIQEITLIARTDQNSRSQPTQAPSTSVKFPQAPHYAAYIRLSTIEHASHLLSHLRSENHLDDQNQSVFENSLPRRLFAVDFASSRQTTLVNSLRLNAARSGGSSRIRVISAASVERSKEVPMRRPICNNSSALHGTTSQASLFSRQTATSVLRSQRCLSKSNVFCQPSPDGKSIPSVNNSSSNFARFKSSSKSDHTVFGAAAKSTRPRRSANCSDTSLSNVDHARDTSPSSVSTTSSSSSASSESTSSSSSSSSSSSVSSCTSSPSSTRSKSRRSASNPSAKPKSGRTRTAGNTKGSRATTISNDSHLCKPYVRKKITSATPDSLTLLKSTDASSFLWADTNSASTRQPLSVMTIIPSTVMSPARSCTTSSGGLSSPGASSSTAVTGLSSNPTRTSGCGDCLPVAISSIGNRFGISSLAPTATSTTVMIDEFQGSRVVHTTSSSASSGVSSGSRSFCSNSSSDGSPLNRNTSQHNLSISNSTNNVTSDRRKSTKSSPPFSNISTKSRRLSTTDNVLQHSNPRVFLSSPSMEQKSRLYCAESSSGLKLHLSTSCPSSSSPAVQNNSTTAPLTVSIKLSGPGPQSQNAITSPHLLPLHSASLFLPNEDKRSDNVSLPLTPLSAPPTSGNPSRPPTDTGGDKLTTDYAAEAMSSHSTDWVGIGSPVYESMYDKIKRRTNKEAEERRQRQLEALSAREMKHKKRKKDEQLCKSPPLNGIPYTPPESFGSENSSRTVATNSSSKSGSRSSRPKTDAAVPKLKAIKDQSRKRVRKKYVSVGSRSSGCQSLNRLDPTGSQIFAHVREHETLSRNSSRIVHAAAKKPRRNRTPLSSSVSSGDERDSSSPPGTLTRLSLGMRFPVSATYHECVRPSGDSFHSKWSTEEEDESLSRLSSVSCSGSDKSERRFRTTSTNWSRMLAKFEHTIHTNGHKHPRSVSVSHSIKNNIDESHRVSCVRVKPPPHVPKSSRPSSKDNCSTGLHKCGSLARSDGATKSKTKRFDTVRRDVYVAGELQQRYTSGKKRHCDKVHGIHEQKRQRVCLRSVPVATPQDHRNQMASVRRSYKRHIRTSQSYFSDDGTVLDSESEDKFPEHNVDSFAEVRWSQTRRPRRVSCSLRSLTDDSTPPITRSPSPVPCRNLSRITGKPWRCSIHSSSVCGDSVGQMDEDGDSVSEAFHDSDRYSVTSKSTPSTEPMEQSELVERDLCMKFSDDEWHSSIVSTSPHPTNLDFDVDYCPVDRTEQSSTTYQSTSFSSQLLSPVGKLASLTPDESDDDALRLDQTEKLLMVLGETEQLNEFRNCSNKVDSLPCNRKDETDGKSPSTIPCESQCQSSESVSFHESLVDVKVPRMDFSAVGCHSQTFECINSGLIGSAPSDRDISEVKSLVSSPTTAIQQVKASEDSVVSQTKLCPNSPLSVTVKSVSTLPVSSSSPISPAFNLGYSTSPLSTNGCLLPINTPVMVDSKPSSMSSSDVHGITQLQDSSSRIPSAGVKDALLKTTPISGTNLGSVAQLVTSSTQQVARKYHSLGDSPKIIVSSPTKPPTDAHDITRYVQSVIERVKAEKVEETQAASLHQPIGTTCSVVPSIACNQGVRHDGSHMAHTIGPSVQPFSKRCGSNQRKPLLVATSACSAVKPGFVNSSLKLSLPMSVNSTLGDALRASELAKSDCPSSLHTPSPTAPSLLSTSTTDLHMPWIPGVNACAPLALSLPSTSAGRVTRQQTHLSLSKRMDLIELTTSHASSTATPSARRRRRSEGRSLSGFSKDPVHAPHHSLPNSNQSTSDSTKAASQSGIVLSTACPIGHDDQPGDSHLAAAVNISNSVCPISSVTASFGKPHASVDPYEPNFDEESPPGFDHSQLHPHRASPSVCSSPRPLQPHSSGSRKSSSSPLVTLSPTVIVPIPVTCSSPALTDCCTTSVAPTLNTNSVADSVDEVIRDVCAGQFDVQSYLNSWRSEQSNAFPRVSRNAISPKITTATQSIYSMTKTTAACVPPKPVTISASLSSVKPFPISLRSEPVVAAVTIPVSSSTNTSKPGASGKSGASSVVNIGTGNALLNTLLAALQLIPGSQVTVTGPAAAAGVVGGIGTGTISATTITLPVNAARQAAANIKAAVLSATNSMPTANADTTQVTAVNDKTITTDVAVSKTVVSEALRTCPTPIKTTPSTMITTSSATHSPLTRTQSSVLTVPNSLPTPVPNSMADVTLLHVQRPVTVLPKTPLPVARTTDAVPADIYKTVSFSESLLMPRQTKNPPPLDSMSGSGTTTRPLSSSNAHIRSVAVPIVSSSAISGIIRPSNPCVAPQCHDPSNICSSFASPQLPGVAPHQQLYGRSPGHTSSASLTSGRSPPLSSPSLITHTIQTLADRLGGAVEPSVLIALAQAAIGGANVCSGLNETSGRSETDTQIFNYLRRLVHQLNDVRCNGSVGKHLTNSLDTQGQSIHPTVSPPLTTPLLPQLNQRLPPSVTSTMYGSGISSDAVLAAVSARPCINTECSTLMSPPIVSTRSLPSQTTHVSTTTTASSNHTSSNAVAHAYPLVWQGRLSLKNAETRVSLHYIYGNPSLLHDCMRLLASGGGGQSQHSLVSSGGPLRIVQRMRLEISQLEGVQRKIHQEGASCVCLALPAGNDPVELMQQTQILNDSFIRYMQEKMAAGIINVGFPDFQQGLYVVHIFPPCEFSHSQLNLAAPELHCRVAQTNQSHLLVVITTV